MVKHRLGRRGGQFLNVVIADLTPHHVPPETIVGDVFAVLAEKLGRDSSGRLRARLPRVLQPLWPDA